MKNIVSGQYIHSYPGRIAVVTSHLDNNINMMAVGWHTYMGSCPETYGISIRKETKTWSLITSSGFFGVNFMRAEHSDVIHHAGILSGNTVDKFSQLNVLHELSDETGAPILNDAYLTYECKLVDARPYADHIWIVGTILQTHKDENCFLDDGSIDLEHLEVPLYIGRSNYRTLNTQAPQINHWHEKAEK